MKTDKTCFITGGSRGLGEFLAQRFWHAGFSLCLAARGEAGLARVARALPERKGQHIARFVCDLGDPGRVLELAGKVRATVPRLDVLVNNAAIHGPIGPLWECNLSMWKQTIQVNLLAPVALCHAFVPWMKKTGGGSIINLSGGGATGPRANFSAYAAAKAGLVRFSETLAEETGPLEIRVNCIAPGAMKTTMLGEILEKGAGAAGERAFAIANKVFAEGGASMDSVADLALFLASDASKGITGKLISAVWDPWQDLKKHKAKLAASDIYTLRRIVPEDRGEKWN